MKRILFATAAILISIVGYASPRTLSVNDKGEFKIVQFSNIFMDSSNTNYAVTMMSIQNVIDLEMPDLVVLTGDTVDPRFEENYLEKFEDAIQYF